MQHCVGGLGLLRRKTAIIRSWFQTPFPKGYCCDRLFLKIHLSSEAFGWRMRKIKSKLGTWLKKKNCIWAKRGLSLIWSSPPGSIQILLKIYLPSNLKVAYPWISRANRENGILKSPNSLKCTFWVFYSCISRVNGVLKSSKSLLIE